MKNILVNSILALAMLSLAGCYESANSVDSTVKTTKAMKCGAGKCGSAKKAMKCGDGKKEMPMKCGAGKCGSAK